MQFVPACKPRVSTFLRPFLLPLFAVDRVQVALDGSLGYIEKLRHFRRRFSVARKLADSLDTLEFFLCDYLVRLGGGFLPSFIGQIIYPWHCASPFEIDVAGERRVLSGRSSYWGGWH